MKPYSSPSSGGGSKLSEFLQKVGGFFSLLRPQGVVSGLVILGVGCFIISYGICASYIRPDEFAVKQVDVNLPLLTGPQGIQTNIYQAGTYWLIPGCEKFLVFPKSVRVVTLHSKERREGTPEKYVRYEEAAHIQTSDGFFINLDVSILYRVVDPYKVIKAFGAGLLYEQNGIILQAEPTLKATMGTLQPEDLFNSRIRVTKQEEARVKFNEFLTPRGLKVDHVLIRYPQYHEAVQARIEARNIQEQTKLKNIEGAKLAQAQADLNEVEKQGEANMTIKLMEGSNFVTRLAAQMEAYQRIKQSDANKLTLLAEAEKQKLINDSYQGTGSDRLIGLEWAKVLGGLDTIVLQSGGSNGFDPFNVDRFLKQLKISSPEAK